MFCVQYVSGTEPLSCLVVGILLRSLVQYAIGGIRVKFRNWVYLFFTTLGIGAVAALVIGIYFWLTDPEYVMDGSVLIVTAGAGMMFSVLSQMGFFAYMLLNFFARSMFRRRQIWATLQWFIVIVVFVDLVYLRVLTFEPDRVYVFSVLPIVLLVVSLFTAWWKVRLTQSTAFTPTVFFMFVATSLEVVPALRENNMESTLFMVVPLLCCNAWQILNLQRLVQTPEAAVKS